jgi:hypothetical protein
MLRRHAARVFDRSCRGCVDAADGTPETSRLVSLPRDLWPGAAPPPERWKDPDEFESQDSFFLSLRLRFLLFLRRLRIRR